MFGVWHGLPGSTVPACMPSAMNRSMLGRGFIESKNHRQTLSNCSSHNHRRDSSRSNRYRLAQSRNTNLRSHHGHNSDSHSHHSSCPNRNSSCWNHFRMRCSAAFVCLAAASSTPPRCRGNPSAVSASPEAPERATLHAEPAAAKLTNRKMIATPHQPVPERPRQEYGAAD